MINTLKTLTAGTFALAFKTQACHWNVTGLQFAALHALFESQYDELNAQLDELAERLRALDHMAPVGLQDMVELSVIKDMAEGLDAKAMILALKDDHKTLSAALIEAASVAADNNDPVTEDMLIGMAQNHDKTAWMLKAHLA